MSRLPTNLDLASADLPPMFVEEFTYRIDARDIKKTPALEHAAPVVVAMRPDGQEVRSEGVRLNDRDPASPIVGTHTLEWPAINELAIRSKNAYHFIWKINRTAMA